MLLQNCFPRHLIDKLIKRFLDGQYVPKLRVATVSKLPILLYLPYLGQYSLRVKKKLCNEFLSSAYPHVDIRVVFQSAKRIENLFPFKDRVPAQICSSAVYKFLCSSCKATYYGKTSRHFVVRCREHLGINKKGLSIKSTSSSTRDHVNATGHAASLNDFCILDKANNNFNLLIHESLLILRDCLTLNQQNSSLPLYRF